MIRNNIINKFGNEYMKNAYKVEVKKEIVYNAKKIPIAKDIDGNIITLELNDAKRILFLGSSGSGKTYFLRSICDRLNKCGYAISFLSDTKDEFKSSKKPVQSKFMTNLLEHEKPNGMDVVTLRPTYFKKSNMCNVLPPGNEWYSIDPMVIQENDFLTLMRASKGSENTKFSLQMISDEFIKYIKSIDLSKVDFNFDIIDSLLDNIKELSNTQKNSLKRKFRTLYSSKFYINKYRKNLVNMINEGKIPAINFQNFELFKDGVFVFHETLLGMALYELIVARRLKKIKPIFIVLDELLRFVDKNKENNIKSIITESYQLDRRYGVNYISVVQDIIKCPDIILDNSNYIFIPSNIKAPLLTTLLNSNAAFKTIQSAPNFVRRIKMEMKKYKYSWLMIDVSKQTHKIILPLSPLSNHMEASMNF